MEITVNGETIPGNLFDQEKDRLHMEPDSPPYEELDEIVKNNLVGRLLIRQAAKKADFEIPDSEIDASLEDMIEEAGGEDLFYSRYGITRDDEDEVREEIEVTLKVEHLLDEITREITGPSGEEIRNFYENNLEKLSRPEETEAAHILKSVHCEEEAPDAYGEMRALRQQLLDGADFEKLADQHSSGEEEGGYLGRFSRGKMLPEFEAIAFSMNPGEISPVFATQFGYHIVKVIGRTEKQQLSLEEATPQIVEEFVVEQKNKLIEDWVEQQKAAATITTDED